MKREREIRCRECYAPKGSPCVALLKGPGRLKGDPIRGYHVSRSIHANPSPEQPNATTGGPQGGVVSTTRKVVINVCHGGFGLSPSAVRRFADMEGRGCHFFVHERADGTVDFSCYREITQAEATERGLFWSAFDIPTPGDHNGEGWYKRHSLPSGRGDIERDDPRLVAIVEEMGEAADGSCARLRVVEIPGDVEWEIDEYDGSEHIAETHRTWR